jgi:hypothetical protein
MMKKWRAIFAQFISKNAEYTIENEFSNALQADKIFKSK